MALTEHLRLADQSRASSGAPTYAALGYRFAVDCTDEVIRPYLEYALRDLRSDQPADAIPTYRFRDLGSTSSARHVIQVNGERVAETARPWAALTALFWHINRRATEFPSGDVLLHAAGAVLDGRGVILPARMESGKTTLVASLVVNGFSYLTDEAVAVAPPGDRITGLPKALTIDQGSWPLLPELAPQVDDATGRYVRDRWHVPASSIRAGAVADEAVPRVIVWPTYEPTRATELEVVPRPQMLVHLIENSFNMNEHRGDGFRVLARLVARCDCYRLWMGDLDQACQAVRRALGDCATSEEPLDGER